MAQVVEYLPLHKALSSNFHTTKKKKVLRLSKQKLLYIVTQAS
jgi:hypothetical protein